MRYSSQTITIAGKTAFLTVVVDISDWKRAERALRESEERFRLLLQNSNDIISVIDDTGKQLMISGPLGKVLGYVPEELLGREGFDWVHPADREAVGKDFARVLAEPGTPKRSEFRMRHTVDGMLKMLRRLIGEDIQLAWLPGPTTGLVKMDPSQVDQILAKPVRERPRRHRGDREGDD